MSRANKNFLNATHHLWQWCQWCLKSLRRDEATADHLIPSSRGGSDYWDNLLVCCYDCNQRKRNKRVVSRKGAWCDRDMGTPHGPCWFGSPHRPGRAVICGYWCKCHAGERGRPAEGERATARGQCSLPSGHKPGMCRAKKRTRMRRRGRRN